MKKLSIFSVFALVLLMSSRAFAGKPEAPRPAAPEPAKASFLLSLEVAPEAPALPDFLTGQPAPSPRTCQGNCFAAYNACKARCVAGDTVCYGNCFDNVLDPCQCSCGMCR